MSVNKLTK